MVKKIMVLTVLIMMLCTSNVFALDTYGGYNVPVDIDINGSFIKCTEKPIMINGSTYIPLRAFSDAIGGTISWDGVNEAATMMKDGHTFVFYPGKGYCLIDGVTKNYAAIMYKDLTFIPVRAVSEALGYGVSWDAFYLTVKITAPGLAVPENFRDGAYTYEDILYLAKITQIESGSQHFTVKLGVAGTVVNRVKSSLFPNSIKGVIFDTKYGTQFPPAHTSRFDKTPSTECMIAAKCVLGGVNVVGNALYFIDTKHAASSWAHRNRPYLYTIYDMSFYG